MFSYWLSVLSRAFWDSIYFVGESSIFFGTLVPIIIAIWLWKKHGWANMKAHWWRMAGEGLVFAFIAGLVIFAGRFIYTPYAMHMDINTKQTKTNDALTVCRLDLGSLDTKQGFLEKQAESHQEVIASQQQLLNKQQSTMNSCVVALGKAAVPEPQQFTILHGSPLVMTKGKTVFYFLLLTNKPITPVSIAFECQESFNGFAANIMREAGLPQMQTAPQMIGNRKGHVQITSPPWTAKAPLLVAIYSDQSDHGGCSFKLPQT